MSSFESSENIQKKEDGPDRSVSDNQSSSVTLNELAYFNFPKSPSEICLRHYGRHLHIHSWKADRPQFHLRTEWSMDLSAIFSLNT